MSVFRQFGKFSMIGGLCTAIQYVVLVLLVSMFGLDATLASSIGFLLSAGLNFDLNYRLTFASTAPYAGAALSFILVAAVGFGANAALMALCTRALGLHYLVAQVLSTGVVLCWNFYANRRWTYSAARERNAPDTEQT